MMRTYVHAYGWPQFVLILLSQCLGWLEQRYLLPPTRERARLRLQLARLGCRELGRPSEHDGSSYPRSSAIPLWKKNRARKHQASSVVQGRRRRPSDEDESGTGVRTCFYPNERTSANNLVPAHVSRSQSPHAPSFLSFFLSFLLGAGDSEGRQAEAGAFPLPRLCLLELRTDGRTDAARRRRGLAAAARRGSHSQRPIRAGSWVHSPTSIRLRLLFRRWVAAADAAAGPVSSAEVSGLPLLRVRRARTDGRLVSCGPKIGSSLLACAIPGFTTLALLSLPR